MLNPEKRLYVYDRRDFESQVVSGALASYDFVFIPSYKLEALKQERFDLCLAVASLQEVTDAQAVTYLDLIRATCTGVFYSWNMDSMPNHNREVSNLSELLRSRFDLDEEDPVPVRRQLIVKARQRLKRAAVTLGLVNRPDQKSSYLPHHEYIARPRGALS